MEKHPSFNVLGSSLQTCSTAPMTGFFRDGACDTCAADQGSHTVCAVMTAEFLAFRNTSATIYRRRGQSLALQALPRAMAGVFALAGFCRPMTKVARHR